MEGAIRLRVKARHDGLLKLMQSATDMKTKMQEGRLYMNDLLEIRTKLKTASDSFETECLRVAEYYTEEDSDEQGRYISDQMKTEELLSELDTIIKCNEKTVQENNARTSHVTSKLPKLELIKYKGEITKWKQFWDNFEANVNSKSLQDVEKLTYLVGALEGKARDALEGLSIENSNYKIAIETLMKRFGDPRKIVDAHFTALSDVQKCSYNYNACRKNLNIIQQHLRVLESLGENIESSHLRSLITSKFPSQILFEIKKSAVQDGSIAELRDFLEILITAMENTSPHDEIREVQDRDTSTSTTRNLHAKAQRPMKRKREQTERRDTFKKRKVQCVFCEGAHFNQDCKVVVTKSERKKKIDAKRLCYICLRPDHFARKCTKRIRCRRCGSNHNTVLCYKNTSMNKTGPLQNKERNENKKAVEEEKNKTQESAVRNTGNKKHNKINLENTFVYNICDYDKTYLQTATTQIKNETKNKYHTCRLLMDNGSQRSYITSRLAKRLNLKADREDLLQIYTFGADKPTETVSPSVTITLLTKRKVLKNMRVNIVPYITSRLPCPGLETSEQIDIVADDGSEGEAIDLLIGNNYYRLFIRDKYIEKENNIYFIDSDFGWTVSGGTGEQDNSNLLSVLTYCQCDQFTNPYFSEPDLPLRDIDMKFLWSLESIGIVDSPKATRDEETIKHFNQTINYTNGRYEVKWPWIEYPPNLPSNFGLALGRLKGLLKRSDEEVLKDYKEILNEQLQAGIIEIIDPETARKPVNHPIHYLSHHMVKQPGKRGRIVCDGSAHLKDEKSVNECMYKGPSLLEDLNALLLKFRTGKIGITADVEKAFLQVGLQAEDRDVTRFLWVKDATKELSEDNLIFFRFCRVPFGIISSPFLLTATIRHHLANTNEELLKKVADRCYVDNLVTVAKSLEDAEKVYKETRQAFEELSMNIRDWTSNDVQFMNNIPTELRSKAGKEVKVLGVNWNLEEDTLHLRIPDMRINPNEEPVTKRNVLRTIARIYDPCGFASPIILPAKLLFQQTCIKKLKWNSELPSDMLQEWKNMISELEYAKTIAIPRYIGKNMPDKEHPLYELHCYADASKDAYAAVVYIVSRGLRKTISAFLMSKSRVTPIEDKTDLKIPRLELLAVLIGSRLLKYVSETLDLPINKKYLWTDSMIVLAWLKTNKLLPPFVSRRIYEIKTRQEVEHRYVPTDLNPADVATRPGILKSKTQFWFHGPEYLLKGEEYWPSQRDSTQQVFLSVGESLNHEDGSEMATRGYEGGDDELNEIIQDAIITEKDEVEDRQLAELRQLQREHFPEEVSGRVTSLTRNLGIFLDEDQILRCKGRMGNTEWSYNKKYPVLIPKESEFTKDLILKTHKDNYHVGVAHTLSIIRQNFWIPQGRAQVLKILKKCPQCIKHGGGPYKLPNTPALSSERVTLSTPFEFTGIDYFGPLFVQTSGGKEKRWICLYTCLAIRAISLEVINNLTADQCLMALRRFIAYRGKPNMIVSDNATQFKLTSEVLADPHCVENGIRWKFIPQLAPWHGGVYERLIALVKNCLKRTLDKHLLQDGQLITVIKEVEAVVNTRPLTMVGSEVECVLRPADFLSPGSCLELTPTENTITEGTTVKIDLMKSWKRGQKILSEFKKMFHEQYLPSLRERYKQYPKQPRVTSDRLPKVGDVVQIKDDSKNRINWKVGRISELIEGQDGQCRVAKVKVGDNELTRSIGHLYPLEADIVSNDTTSDAVKHVEKPVEEITTDNNGSHVEKPVEEMTTDNIGTPQIVEIEVPGLNEVEEVEMSSHQPVEMQIDMENAPYEVQGDSLPEPEELPRDVDKQPSASSDVVNEEPLEEAFGDQNNSVERLRLRREAAIRAREKIAEWTRQLSVLL